MEVFDHHGRLVEDYHLYVDSFIQIKDKRIRDKLDFLLLRRCGQP